MPIDFPCPDCGAPITVPDEYAGLKGRCQACGNTVIVPGQQTEEVDALPVEESPRPAEAPRRPADPFANLGSSGQTDYTGLREDPMLVPVRLIVSILIAMFVLCCLGGPGALFFRAVQQSQHRNR